MNRIDISSEDLEIIKKIALKHVPKLEIRAFGSRVTGKASRNSDLDIVIMTTVPLDTLIMIDLKEAFSESDLPFKVDIVDWAITDERFRNIISKQAITII